MGENYSKRLTLLLLFILSWIYSIAQTDSLSSGEYPDDPIWYYSFGVSPYSNYISAPSISIPNSALGNNESEINNQSLQYHAMQLLSFSYSVRANIYRIDNDRSLSLNMPISLGLSSIKCVDGSRGFLSLSAPLMLEYNVGTASNFSTLEWKGWMIGAGAEFNVFPLVSNEKYLEVPTNGVATYYKPSHWWIQPTTEIAYRWINTNQDTREINLKFGCGLPKNVNGTSTFPFTAKITYIYLINY